MTHIAYLKRFFRIFPKKNAFFGAYTSLYTKKSFFFFVFWGTFWAYTPYTRKKSFFWKMFFRFSLIPPYTRKKLFFIENDAFFGAYTPYTRKKSFFLKFQKMVLAYTTLIHEKKAQPRKKKSYRKNGPGNLNVLWSMKKFS